MMTDILATNEPQKSFDLETVSIIDSGILPEIVAVSPSNVYDTKKMKYLLNSAKHHGFGVTIIGLNQKFEFLSKILWFKVYLASLPTDTNPIVCFTDAYDVIFVDALDIIRTKFLSFKKNIVWSVERWYSHQLKIDKNFYDGLSDTPYKYINTGTFIGYKKELLQLMTDIENSLKNQLFLSELRAEGWDIHSSLVDQTIISHHLAKHWDKYSIILDYNCSVFYIPCGDWDDIDKFVDRDLKNIVTGNIPSIIHVPWKSKFEHILSKLYNMRFSPLLQPPLADKTFSLINKKYTWNSNVIQFTTNCKMNAFGPGTYTYTDACTIVAKFGAQIHTIVFSPDYSSFISTRKCDGERVTGQLIR